MTIRIILCCTLLAFTTGLGAQPRESESLAPYDFMVAKLAAEQGDFEQALRLIDRVVEKEPNNPVVLFERATILLESGRGGDAERELKRLVALHPDFYDAVRLLGRVVLEGSRGDRARLEEAMTYLRKAVELVPSDFGSGLTVAQILIGANRLQEAEKVLSGLAELFPDNRIINFNYAQLLTKMGRGNESQKFLERVIASDASYAPAALQLVDIYQKSSEWAKAAETLEALAASDPLNRELSRQLAYFHFRAGNSEKARQQFQELLAADPRDDQSRFFLGEALNDLGEYAEAEKIYRQLLEREPKDPELLVSFGLNQIAQRHTDEAEKAFLALIEQQATLPPGITLLARTQLATIEHLRGNYGKALSLARESIRGPKGLNTQAVSLVLDVYRRTERYDDALTFLQPLVREYGTDPALNARYLEFLLRSRDEVKAKAIADVQIKSGLRGALAVAQTYAQVERWPEAIGTLEALRKQHAEEKSVIFQLGSAYERSGRVADAEKIFLGLLESDPNDAQALNYLGYMWADSGKNLSRAADMIERAVAQEPKNGAFVDSLGWVYYQQGKLDLALKHLSEAVELMPWDATIHEHLGDVHLKKGDATRAAESYRAALKLDPEPRDEQKIRTKLEQLEKSSLAGKTN
jgi:predicted Zn-dependent protease